MTRGDSATARGSRSFNRTDAPQGQRYAGGPAALCGKSDTPFGMAEPRPVGYSTSRIPQAWQHQRIMDNVLFTSFAPFDDDTENPSQQSSVHHPLADSRGGRLQHAELAVARALAYRSILPLGHCYERLQAADIPVEFSYSAGIHLCNEVFYAALRHASSHVLQYKAGFVHMPDASAYIAWRGHLASSLSMSVPVEALDLIVQECMQ